MPQQIPANSTMTHEGMRVVDSVELLRICAEDRSSTACWSELLRRISPKITIFIRRTLRQSLGNSSLNSSFLGGEQENDLFQNVIMRLVKDDCAAMKRFSGSSEEDLLAYLAVISRSVVRDCLRRNRALKRPVIRPDLELLKTANSDALQGSSEESNIERRLLARELSDAGLRMIDELSGDSAGRDRLIFKLYFFNELSAGQIAACRGVNLSKAGVEKVLGRLKAHVRRAAQIPASSG